MVGGRVAGWDAWERDTWGRGSGGSRGARTEEAGRAPPSACEAGVSGTGLQGRRQWSVCRQSRSDAVPARPLPVRVAPVTALPVSLQQTAEHRSVPPRDALQVRCVRPVTCCRSVSWLKSWWVLYSVRK